MTISNFVTLFSSQCVAKMNYFYYKYSRIQRLCFLSILTVLFSLYFFWNAIPFTFELEYVKTNNLDVCMEDRLRPFKTKLNNLDAVKYLYPISGKEKYQFPFVGNGYIGCSWHGAAKLNLRHHHSLSVMVEYYPLISLSMPNFVVEESFVIEFIDGIMYKLQCLKQNSLCISVGSMAYTHRSIPELLIQNIRIYNPTNLDATLQIERESHQMWKGVTTKSIVINETYYTPSHESTKSKAGSLTYRILIGTVESGNDASRVVIAEPNLPNTLAIKAGGTTTFRYLTVIRYSRFMPKKQLQSTIDEVTSKLQSDVTQVLVDVSAIQELDLREKHKNAWNKIWETGMAISKSLAPDALNGEEINNTLYILVSHSHAPLHHISTTASERTTLIDMLNAKDHCYRGFSTLQAKRLWSKVEKESDMAQLVENWFITLDKQGCHKMLKVGADGVIQAVVLSMGSLRFVEQHLEFAMNPEDLHRDYVFRGLQLSPNSSVEITVELDEGNKAIMYVMPASSNLTLYACDAGCQDDLVKLENGKRTSLPIKITAPLTPILYLSSSQSHLQTLHRSIHVSSVVDAPAHGHHVIALHRHGHALGGLPVTFWVTVVLLVGLFHAFLLKLICNEYLSGQANIPPPPPHVHYPSTRYRYFSQ